MQKDFIEEFYTAFSNREAIFKDEIFSLKGKEIAAVCNMLISPGKDLELIFRNLNEENAMVTVKQEVIYTFSATKRKVHNKIEASFSFKDNLIWSIIDTFNFLVRSLLVKNKVKKRAVDSLNAFISKHREFQE